MKDVPLANGEKKEPEAKKANALFVCFERLLFYSARDEWDVAVVKGICRIGSRVQKKEATNFRTQRKTSGNREKIRCTEPARKIRKLEANINILRFSLQIDLLSIHPNSNKILSRFNFSWRKRWFVFYFLQDYLSTDRNKWCL